MKCAVLRSTSLTVWKVLSHKALNEKLNEIEKQERSDTAKLARTNAKLKKMPKTAEEKTARIGADVRGNGQGTKHRASELGDSCCSERSSDVGGCPEVRSLTRKNGKQSVCELC